MSWGRLVDVHAQDASGRAEIEPAFRSFVINESIQSDATNYLLETNPITQKTRLVIRRQRNASDFGSLLRFATASLPPVIPKNDDGSNGDQYSFVSRNGVLVLRFDDVLSDDATAELNLPKTVQLRAGYPPTPVASRLFFDPNYGAVVGDEFHSTRVLVDFTISEAELPSMPTPEPINTVGLPPSVTTTTDPNVTVRIPTQTDFGSGQFFLLTGLSGAPLAPFENGPMDRTNMDIVRAMRSGNDTDLNNGFLLDLSPPEVLGGWGLRVDRVLADPQGQQGFDYLLDATFLTVCRTAPTIGDVIQIGSSFLEVAQDGAPPSVDGKVVGLRVRNLADTPLQAGTVLVGNGLFLSAYSPAAQVPAGCWVSFSPQPLTIPSTGVSTDAEVLVRFSEPMDPTSISPFDNFYMVRGDSNSQISSTNLIIGSLITSTDLKEFSFVPLLPLPHDTATPETYHCRVVGATDLAGNTLAVPLPAINFEMDPDLPAVRNGGTVMRFTSTDEVQPSGVPDLRGQIFYDFDRQLIRPRTAAFASYPADRLNPVPSIQIPIRTGIQTPLTALGSRLQTVWRYCDLGWQVLDETKYNMDVYGLSWTPAGGTVINDFFDRFEIALAHSRRLPDEAIDQNLLPRWEFSGLSTSFAGNILDDPLSPQKVVHERTRGYRINGADLFLASTGTIMLPFPLNQDLGVNDVPQTYTWRDNAVLATGGPSGTGVPLDIEAGPPLGLEPTDGYLAGVNNVPSIGLPLLMEYRCYPTSTGLGLNSLDINIAINSSAIPAFRAYSSGGINSSGISVARDPDLEQTARGGFNPLGNPPGSTTLRGDDNALYIGQLDVVTRLSRAHTAWINSGRISPDYEDPIVLPEEGDQPAGTRVILEYRGAEGFEILTDLDGELGQIVDESLYPFDATKLNSYGEIFALLPRTVGTQMVPYNLHAQLGSGDFQGSVLFKDGVNTWTSNIDDIDGATYLQIRITFLSNVETLLSPELSAIAIPYSGQ